MKKFDPTKPVQTRDGRPARILATDINHPTYPIAAVVLPKGCLTEAVFRYGQDGKFFQGAKMDDGCDLVNAPEKITFYVNVWKSKRNGVIDVHWHTEKAHADLWARDGWHNWDLAARFEHTITEGEGIT